MHISIQKPFSISEIGERFNNEDAIFPGNEEVSARNKLFLVCDGVGGASKGEIASSIACESIQTYFNTFLDSEENMTPDFIEKSIRYAEICFDDYLKENPSAKGMATTLCLLYLSSNGLFLTHAGDSRIYQIRDGQVYFRTEDHSIVNFLVKSGKVNPGEIHSHPQKNVIYRAIQGSNVPVEVDVVQLKDLQPGDQFLLCTDGIWEALSEKEICEILSVQGTAESKLTKLKESCIGKARDNYSAYLIPIDEVKEYSTVKQILASFLYAFV